MSSHPTEAAARRRQMCAACLRPSSTCICRWSTPIATDAALLILQHPLEVQQAKGSGRLLHLCVPGSVLLTGEQFDAATLADALGAGGLSPMLLYPGQDGMPDTSLAELAGQGAGLRLVVLDATWRKSRKMLHVNPLLARLPRLSLRDMPPSHYRIRKAHTADQLSSFEAAASALAGLQANAGSADLARWMAAFDGFVDQLATRDPRHAGPGSK